MSATKEKLHNQIESEMRKSQTVNYIKKSAVDWLKPQIELMLMDGHKPYPNQLEEAFEIAKDLENQKQGYSEEEAMEFFIEGYKQRAEKSDLIFDNASRMYAIALFEKFKNK
jgi:hypothetical protein